MKQYTRFLLIALFSIFSIAIFSRITERYLVVFEESDFGLLAQSQDTVPRFPVKKTQPSTYEELTRKKPIDLKDPENLKTEIEYDINTGLYIFKTKLGDQVISTPISLNYDEYMDYKEKESMSKYFQKKNAIARTTGTHKSNDFMLKNVTVHTSDLDRLFGPGGLNLKLSGYAESTISIKNTKTQNPSLSQRNRNRTMFDFDQNIQMNVDASVGDKINFGLNYDTKAAFDFDSKKIKLAYEGKEDEIVKRIEAGNVSMSTTNSLINGGAALFGINTELQFGRLKVNAIASQQEAESRTIQTQGSVQNNEYEFKASDYDENRHFFLARYFRDHYDRAMELLPAVKTGIVINRMEVWVTNKRGGNDARNIVAFADLGEATWRSAGDPDDKLPDVTNTLPSNKANSLYNDLIGSYTAARDISKVTETFSSVLESGQGYEKLERARLLSSSEYTYNEQLGYISLASALQSDEVLGIAFEYTYKGQTYQVGEFGADVADSSTDGTTNTGSGALFVKMLKSASFSPISYTWDLMMKNIYSLGANNIQQEGFKLQISYQADTIGAYISYLPEGNIKNKPLLQVMNLDRLNAQNKAVTNADKSKSGDGVFDFVEGFTVKSESGRIIFPVVEPFGSHLKKQIGSAAIADKYIYPELYNDTKTAAEQVAEKNKFKLYGSYRGNVSSGAEINLNATNVPAGSVKVTAAGVTLQEGVDYIVDYMSGTVTLINQNLIDSNTPVQVSLEDQTFSMQKKTMLGLNLSYDFSKKFNVGATIMHLYEKPLMSKTAFGEESVKNTLWGFNFSYNTQSQWLTNMIDKLPFVEATQPSSISLSGEFAQLIGGHYQDGEAGKYSYLDDFESSESRIDLKSPYAWTLASTPSKLFEEAELSNKIEYGFNRAHMSWFMIDNIFTRQGMAGTPQHIKNDKDQLSNHYVREILLKELYPERDMSFNEVGTISALNLSYYPNERGPYNLNVDDLGPDGKFMKPRDKWGGIMRRMDVRDFEASNVEYIEFWMLDPFVYKGSSEYPENGEGDLYFNLGNISEDILKDGRKFFENGLPADGNMNDVETTVWGKVPKRQATVYAFDNNLGDAGRKAQDVGLNGLSTEEEFEFPAYKEYLEKLKPKLSGTTLDEFNNSPFSPLKDPAGDNYHYYRGLYYDENETSILDRYKYYNGTEGNSPVSGGSNERYSTAARSVPDVEDIDQDYTMNETESFYQYKISLRKNDMNVGSNFITEKREVEVSLRNGKKETVTWYQFKIPIREGEPVNNMRNFKSIRFMRMFLTGFDKPTFLRFGTLQLVRGDWRTYDRTLNHNETVSGAGKIEVTRVNIEENSNKEPVSYVLPPGLDRSQEANQVQLLQNNEQALSVKITDLDPRDARAVYKNTNYDLRRFKRMQMFAHLEELIDGKSLEYGDFTVFIRLGSDYHNNYYEYEIPMKVTPAGKYSSNSTTDRNIVWPKDNMFDFSLEELKNVKLERNKEKRKVNSDVSYTKLYWRYDKEHPANRVSVMGNPSLAEVNVIMLGVRNNSRESKSGEIWFNELRLTDFDEKGGWAAQGNVSIALSDIGTINVSGRKETAGFGALDQSLLERRSDDYTLYNVAINADLGRFLPEKAKVSIPFYYSYSNEKITPEYDPFDTDVRLKESLKSVTTKAERDSIRSLAEEVHTTKSVNFSNVKVNIQSKTPMPYDPANFSFGYSYNETEINNPTTVYDVNKDFQANIGYSYSPIVKTWEPFSNLKGNTGAKKFLKSLGFNYLPNNITANSVMTRFYNESLTRDIDNYRVGEVNTKNEFLSWSQAFYWDRDLSINWDFTKNLKASFQSGTRAEIEEPYLQVNKKQNPDDYEVWKDSVWRSIRNLGDPLSYKQIAKVTYQLPTRSIPALDWINSQAEYTSGYQWDRGATVGIDTLEVGNSISNSLTLETRNRFDLTALYLKNAFLRRVNERFDSRRNTRVVRSTRQRGQNSSRTRRFTIEIELQKDSIYVLKHGLNTKNLDIVAKVDGKPYKLKYKRIDDNTIQIKNKDLGHLQLSVMSKADYDEGSKFWKDVAEYSARGLMSVRSVNFKYSSRKETFINGFKPKIGDMLGQRNTSDYGMVPGLGFAFGFDGGEDYLNRALDRDWLLSKSLSVTPAIYNSAQKMEISAVLEPIKDLKIDLTASREHNRRSEINFYDNRDNLIGDAPMTTMRGGSFSMTTIAISSAFESSNAKNGYKSKAFEKFLANREIIKTRVQNQYNAGAVIPDKGFIKDDNLGIGGAYQNHVQSGAANAVNVNSSDVMIPAFLAAYTGGNAKSISLSLIPGLWALLPNWNMTYDGLSKIPFVKEYAKSVRLSHRYSCFYQIGSYTSYSTWVDAGDGFGFIRDAVSGKPTPSSPYNMSSVSIIEAFNPLFGAETVLNNSLLFNMKYNTARTLNLNSSSLQIVESMDKEWVVGCGYRINDFNRLLGIRTRDTRQNNDRRRKKNADAENITPVASEINNDLNLKFDLSHRTQQALIRRINENYTQATSGTTIFTIKFSADYTLSRSLTLRAFYDRVLNKPLITSVGYTTTNSSFGLSLKYTLQQ